MKKAFTGLLLLLLLVVAQQGAVLHELGHVCHAADQTVRVDGDHTGQICNLCLAYAQLGNAVSHLANIPLLNPAPTNLVPEGRHALATTAAPPPRSRGPPALS